MGVLGFDSASENLFYKISLVYRVLFGALKAVKGSARMGKGGKWGLDGGNGEAQGIPARAHYSSLKVG